MNQKLIEKWNNRLEQLVKLRIKETNIENKLQIASEESLIEQFLFDLMNTEIS